MARSRIDLEGDHPFTLDVPPIELASRIHAFADLGIPQTHAALVAFLGDEAKVRARLLALPPHLAYALFVLLTEERFLDIDAIVARIRAQTRFDADTARMMVEALPLTGCVSPSTLASGPRAHAVSGMALYTPALPTLRALLGGFAFEVPEVAEARVRPPTVPRDAIVARAALAHRDVRVTRAGRPNAASLKPVARALGMPATEFDALLGDVDFAHDGALIRVDLDWLERSAMPDALLGPIVARVAGKDLRAVREIEVAVEREAWRRGPFVEADSPFTKARIHAAVRACCDTVEVDGQLYFRAPRLREATAPDGVVTPAFEVMLGESASARDVAILALACAPQRVDRLVTLRLTPESVACALRAGIDGKMILDALGRVSRHPVPENVAQIVLDWWGKAPARAQAHTGTVVVLPEPKREAAREALRALTERELAPGVLLLARHATPDAVRAAMSRAGLALDGLDTMGTRRVADALDFADDDDERALDESFLHAVSKRLERKPTVDLELAKAMRDAITNGRPITGLVRLGRDGRGATLGEAADRETLLDGLIDDLRELGAPKPLLEAMAVLRRRRTELDAEIMEIVQRIEPARDRPAAALLFDDLDPGFIYLLATDAHRARIRPRLRTMHDLESLGTLLSPESVEPRLAKDVLHAFARHDLRKWLLRREAELPTDLDAVFEGALPPPPSGPRRVRHDGPTIAPDALQKRARQAKQYGKPLTLVCREGEHVVEREVTVVDVRTRDDSFVLLVEDLDTGESRSVPAASVLDARR